MVARATQPSMTRADQVLTRMRPWVTASRVAAAESLVISQATRWPRGTAGAGGRETDDLGSAYFLPRHRDVEVDGIGPGPVPARLRRAATHFARDRGLL